MAGCLSLKSGCIFVAFIDMLVAVLSAIFLLGFVGMRIGSLAGSLTGNDIPDDLRAAYGQCIGTLVVLGLVVILACFGKFYIGLTLMRGVEQGDHKKCNLWFIASSILCALNMICTFFYDPDWAAILISTIYQFSCLLLVYSFMHQLKLKLKLTPFAEEKPGKKSQDGVEKV